MFDWNYDNLKHHAEEMENKIIEEDFRYSVAKELLDHVRLIKEHADELKTRYNTCVRTKGVWEIDENGVCYCTKCRAPKTQVYENFCANCGAEMGKL